MQAYCYYSKVLELDPRNESAVINRAITNTLLNNIEEAKEDFDKAICLCPFSAAAYFNRANFYNGLKQYELAEKDISTGKSVIIMFGSILTIMINYLAFFYDLASICVFLLAYFPPNLIRYYDVIRKS